MDADFDADGYADLVVGIPGEDVGDVLDAGAINVIYGSPTRAGKRTQVFTQDTPGIEEDADESDRFGETLATGDFNADGYADLAVGVPGETVTGFSDGAVNIIYGSKRGLTVVGDQVWTQDTPGVPEEARSGDRFGQGIAAGDFDQDGFSDLAIGTPFEDLKREGQLSAHGSAGAVIVLRGSARGITTDGVQLIHQDSDGVPDDVEAVDLFGWALSTGDFDRDGRCDLAISSPGEKLGTADHAGTVTIVPGSSDGLNTRSAQLWHQGSPGVPDASETNDEFGRRIVAGDFNDDGYSDLAVGAASEDIKTASDAGSVTVIYGGRGGLSTRGIQQWTQDSPGVVDEVETNDAFGQALAADDFDGDGVIDLAVGAPLEGFEPDAPETPFRPGAVIVLLGSRSKGITSAGSRLIYQDSPGMPEKAEHEDHFGLSLGSGDLDGDGIADLIIGAPGERLGQRSGAGVVHVVYGSRSGPVPGQSRLLEQGSDGLPDQPDEADGFGTATAAS